MVPGFSGEEGGGAQESGICMQMHPPPISFRVKCPPCTYNKLYVLYHSWDTGGLTTYYTYFYHKWQYRKDSTQLVDTKLLTGSDYPSQSLRILIIESEVHSLRAVNLTKIVHPAIQLTSPKALNTSTRFITFIHKLPSSHSCCKCISKVEAWDLTYPRKQREKKSFSPCST
ncbi:uncharacterized protein BO95DRAFT_153255 [Aspergillus brunneoviolaceus CBS 621.78]|uniref:Uncharacterized protein n=1 Tax=Aspergillus brunneoviolaceus CBS 621.78 TaxID=1450534 RepID=A0ACD1G7C3_9EURO|nr:hypothetical protein BO95DRAFT_153255 [Aspergillus brunneoviolaceus CBS 621.78]RAH45063.1 hypothetical protein BO95DRAFT_153255 [Aspergillus brunneoviolaceus CBS 621.78]